MKAFKDWKSGHDQKLAEALNNDKRGFELGLELGWRGALKEIQRVIIEESNGPSNPKDLMVWIQEELES